jgi:hypothetical protein
MVIWLFPGEKQEDQKYKITQTIGTAIGLAGEKKKKKTKHNPVTSRWHSAVEHNRKIITLKNKSATLY